MVTLSTSLPFEFDHIASRLNDTTGMTLGFRLISKQSSGLLRAIEAPEEMRAEFKLYLKDLRFVGDPQLSLPPEN